MDDIITISTTDQANTIDLSSIKPVEFNWSEADMSTGIMAQEIGPITTSVITSGPVSIGSTGINTVTIGSYDSGYASKTDLTEIISRMEKLEAMLIEEAEIRANHPAVDRAYDEYRLLMILSKKNPGDFLTED
jgi:hypothetical protein